MTRRQKIKAALPRSVRIDAAERHVENVRTVARITGHVSPPASLAFQSYLAGYDHAAETACRELLDENHQLQNERWEMIELPNEERKADLLRRLYHAAVEETAFHPDDCRCGVCRVLREIWDLDEEESSDEPSD